MVLAIDGADIPTRPETAKGRRPGRKKKRAKRARWKGQWREAKGFRFYLVDGERIVHLLSWHQVQSDEELGEALRQVREAGLIPEDKVRLCVIADGAKWIWKLVKALFPSAVEILDYYHCSGHLHKVASVQFGDNPEKQTEWVEATVARLFCGEVQAVIGDLQRMKARDTQAAEEIRKLIGYLTNNQGRVDYGFARKGGYPIGSGGIESAHKFIHEPGNHVALRRGKFRSGGCRGASSPPWRWGSKTPTATERSSEAGGWPKVSRQAGRRFIGHVRLKRSGAWWYVEQANQMLALRCAKYNSTFDRVFEAYKILLKFGNSGVTNQP